MLAGTFTRYPWAAVVATTGIILAALYILLMYQRTMTGPVRDGIAGMRTCGVARCSRSSPCSRSSSRSGFFPKPCST